MTTTATTTAPSPSRPLQAPTPVERTRPATARTHRTATTPEEVRGATIAGLALLVLTLVSVPAATVLATTGTPDGTAAHLVGVAFLLVALLDVVAAWGLHLVLRRRATPSSTATLVSRCGYAALLAGSALVLAWPGGAGAEGFTRDWSIALVVFGLHLVIAGNALWRSRIAPTWVAAVTTLAGVAYLLDDVLTRLAGTDASVVLVPLMLGELVLVGWLLLTARRGATAF